MCGIIALSSSNAINYSIEKGLIAINHRGPDDMGTFVAEDYHCHLGHVRLSIIDLSTNGHQPMTDSSNRYIISYNGEIYNYRDLQKYLERRHGLINWKSETDTEVIVEGVAKEGISFLSMLNGIFSIAIYDKDKRLLHVLRDPLGVKPLFISEQNGNAYFSSELKGLLALPEIKHTIRFDSLKDQLAFMYIPEPFTLYNEIQKIKPGICFTYKQGKLISEKKIFTNLFNGTQLLSMEESKEALSSAFDIAVKRQLMSDVPVSLFLSGGLDSSAVAKQAILAGANIDSAYTISFSQKDLALDRQGDDLHYAKIMAKYLGINLQVVKAKNDFLSLLPDIINFMDDGFSDPAAINTYLIAKAARDSNVKVMLSGQGADEYLAGYRRYQAERIFSNMPTVLKAAISRMNILPISPGRFNAVSRRITRFINLVNKSPSMRLFSMYSWTTPSVINSLFINNNSWQGVTILEELFDTYKYDDIVEAMMKVDHHYDLMSLNLAYTDRMSMAVGVETRVPFLDFDLVRIMNSIPVHFKLKGRHTKYVFKKAMENKLPKEIIYREKAGFSLPLRSWLSKSNNLIDQYMDKGRITKQGIFNSSIIQNLIDEQRSGKKDHSYTIFTLLCQQLLFKNNKNNE